MMSEKLGKIEMLSHIRHDWLNRIQLIKGYMALGQIEQAERIIDEIVISTQHETKLTSLNLPELALLLITHNWERHQFLIEYEIIGGFQCGSLHDQKLTKWMSGFFELLDEVTSPLHENHLYITLESFEKHNQFLFHFEGIIEHLSSVKDWFAIKNGYPEKIRVREMTELAFVAEVIL